MAPSPRSLREWFEELLPLLAEERERRLAECAIDNPALAAELREVLAAVIGDDAFLAGLPDPAGALPPARATATTIGPYRRVRTLGEGGMGTVWLCEQDAPVHRRVAIKQIKPGLANADFARRFGRERQVLASLQHPGIAAVFDCGDSDDGPWFAMEFVEGTPLLQYCDEHRLPIQARLGLVLDLCAAVQHAHDRQIVHRDLKPSNILVATVDGRPFPKVIDFGLAALIAESAGDERLTRPDQWLGTPEYMAPEQRVADSRVDARADVYALGVVAYELLCGALPFAPRRSRSTPTTPVDPPRPSDRLGQLGADLAEVAATRGMRPSQLRSALRAELDWIVLMAIERDPARRYASVAAFAEDLRRHLQHQPIRARAPSTMQRLRKFVRRRRASLGIAAGAAIALTASMMAAEAARAERQQRADAALQAGRLAARDGRWSEALADFDRSSAEGPDDPLVIDIERHEVLSASGDTAAANDLLARISPLAPGTRHEALVLLLRGAATIAGNRAEGRRFIEQALAADRLGHSRLPPPDHEFAAAMLANDLDTAQQHLQAALAHDSRHLRTMHMLGPVLLSNGQPELGLQLADRYQTRLPHAVEPRMLRAVAHATAGRHTEALAACEAVDEIDEAVGDLVRQVVRLFHILDRGTEWIARHQVMRGFFGHARANVAPVVQMPPLALPSDLALSMELGALQVELLGCAGRFLQRNGLAAPAMVGIQVGWHPVILDSYAQPKILATLTAARTQRLPDNPDDVIPESILGVLWKVGARPSVPEWTGWSAAMPAVRRLHAWMDFSHWLAIPRHDSWQLAPEHQAKFAEAADRLAVMRLSDDEFLLLGYLVVNFRHPDNSDRIDRVLTAWETPDKPSTKWLLFKAELNLSRGARAEAQRLVDRVPANDQPAWVQSLRDRLR
ncbi:MAG: protein kinase [Planctomycetes bacterium]|nr:protein kinase [Planctomycetota bacterium]